MGPRKGGLFRGGGGCFTDGVKIGVDVGHLAEGEGFVGEADAVERAAVALGAVVEGRGDNGEAGGGVGLGDVPPGGVFEVVGERHVDPGAGPGEVEDAVVAGVAVLAEQQALDHELDAFGFPRAFGVLRNAAALGVDRHRLIARGADQVELGAEAQRRRLERDRAGDGGRVVAPAPGSINRRVAGFGFRQRVVEPVDAAVHVAAVDGVGVVGPAALDVHQVVPPRAVRKLVHHVEGELVGVGGGRDVRGHDWFLRNRVAIGEAGGATCPGSVFAGGYPHAAMTPNPACRPAPRLSGPAKRSSKSRRTWYGG